DPAAAIGLAGAAGRLGDDRSHRDEQPAALIAEGHRQHPRPTLGNQPLQPPGVLLAPKLADDRQGEVPSVDLQAHRASVKPDPASITVASLEARESDPRTGSPACL